MTSRHAWVCSMGCSHESHSYLGICHFQCWLDLERIVTRMAGVYLLLVIGLSSTTRITCQSDCKDLDTNACQLMAQSRPNLCLDASLSSLACPRFCHQCPLLCYDCSTPLKDPTLCNTTSTCAGNETCLLKELKSFDGHHEYIMSCASREVCEGGALGFVFGKREAEKRDVTLSCCTTDLCNYPFSLTSTTASAPTTVTISSGQGCNKDVVFLIDDTNSITTVEFQQILHFLENVINHLDIGPSATRVAMVTFDTGSHVQWYLDTYQDKRTLLTALHNVHPHGGNEHAADALLFIKSNILVDSHGDRPSAPDVVLFLTDGTSVDGHLEQAAQQLHAKSSDIIAIGVEGAYTPDLEKIATDRQHIISIRNVQSLLQVVSRVILLICQ